jgi:2-isopropylmalate synthase
MGLAVINSVEAVRAGAIQVQGTMNGFGERCGNANLVSIIPILSLKMGCSITPKLSKLKTVSDFFWEVMNVNPPKNQPFVGISAFAHKGGVHIDAVLKKPQSYEHIDPKIVGNERRVLISDLSGKSAASLKLKKFNIEYDEEKIAKILESLKRLEAEGYDFESAEASLELLVREIEGTRPKFFEVKGFRVHVEKHAEELESFCEATIKVNVDGKEEHTAAEGRGPVNALDNALRKALEKFYPQLKEVSLKDFKVRVVSTREGTAAAVRVFIESGDGRMRWGTVGVSRNIIEASWKALVDSVEYKLMKSE